MRILADVEIADSGGLFLDSTPIQVRSPREAAAHGISVVHQELSVLPNLNVAENIFAGRELIKSIVLVDRELGSPGSVYTDKSAHANGGSHTVCSALAWMSPNC